MSNISILDNGFRIASTTMSDTDTVSLNIWVKTGSRDENEKENGLSHFLEHMAFKGTEKRSAQNIAESFDNIGGFLNASTSREFTIYYAKVLKEDVDVAIEILADIMQNSVFDHKELERERGVILQEIAMTNDTPDDIIFDRFQETAYNDQAIGRSILGSNNNVANFKSEDMHNFMHSNYSVNEMLFAVAGKIEHDHLLEITDKNFYKLKKTEKPLQQKAKYTGGFFTEERNLEQVHLILGFETISYLTDDIYALQLLSILLGGGMSSRLFQEVREKHGLAYSIYSFSSHFNDTGTFSVYASCDPKDVGDLTKIVGNVLNNTSLSISEEELIRAKNQARAALLMGYERSSFRADELGRNIACFGRDISKAETLAKIDAVNSTEVLNLLKQIIKSPNPTVAALGKLHNLPDYDSFKGMFG